MGADRRAQTEADVPPAARINLPTASGRRLGVLLRRALVLRCPYCGGAPAFAGWWTVRERCPNCHVKFEREEGYFLGAYAINLIVAEILGVGAVIALLLWSDLSTVAMQIIAVVFVIGLPLFFFPYSRSLWMAIDLMIHRPIESPRR